MNEANYNKLGIIDIIEIDKLIIENSELDDLKQLVVVSKYFNSIVYKQFPNLNKLFKVLGEYSNIVNIISNNDVNHYYNVKFKQIDRKLIDFLFRSLRKNKTIIVKKVINYCNKYNSPAFLLSGNFYYRLFYEIILGNYTNEQILLRNLIKICHPKIDWVMLINFFENWFEDLQIENIILTILDLLKAAIFLKNEDFILILVKGYYQYDLYNYEETPKDIHLELVQLIESLEESSEKYGDIAKYGQY